MDKAGIKKETKINKERDDIHHLLATGYLNTSDK
jgi:hypothetical protein